MSPSCFFFHIHRCVSAAAFAALSAVAASAAAAAAAFPVASVYAAAAACSAACAAACAAAFAVSAAATACGASAVAACAVCCCYRRARLQHLDKVGEMIATATDDRLLHELSEQWGDHQVGTAEKRTDSTDEFRDRSNIFGRRKSDIT